MVDTQITLNLRSRVGGLVSTEIGAARAKRKSLRAACCAKSNFATEARKEKNYDFTNHFTIGKSGISVCLLRPFSFRVGPEIEKRVLFPEKIRIQKNLQQIRILTFPSGFDDSKHASVRYPKKPPPYPPRRHPTPLPLRPTPPATPPPATPPIHPITFPQHMPQEHAPKNQIFLSRHDVK
ncbi:hypothetical protein RND71_001986 [Anisodus tanguticus]|uniref:Uncharacterized protein n=1 Tax=Anisodus tanguticus TaxID=243964 RepID=A0AAE1VYE7_9SOLA|nr:hypothetical protein RND71_001986 [Anisodus tanguticus]